MNAVVDSEIDKSSSPNPPQDQAPGPGNFLSADLPFKIRLLKGRDPGNFVSADDLSQSDF